MTQNVRYVVLNAVRLKFVSPTVVLDLRHQCLLCCTNLNQLVSHPKCFFCPKFARFAQLLPVQSSAQSNEQPIKLQNLVLVILFKNVILVIQYS